MDPNPYVKYQNPNSSGSQDFELTRFSIATMAESKTEHNPVNISRNSLKN